MLQSISMPGAHCWIFFAKKESYIECPPLDLSTESDQNGLKLI